jgi:hypothetical protein
MEIAEIRERLALAEDHVRRGKAAIDTQLEVIADLDARGADSSEARTLLRTFEEIQVGFEQDRERFIEELRGVLP